MIERTLWLVKDSDDVINWCNCEESVSGHFPQLDCPWCGCGWLFSCAFCGKSFTFARFAWFEESLEALALRLSNGSGEPPESDESVAQLADFMKWAAEGFEEGDRVVVIDYMLFRVDEEGPFEFDGVYAHHELEELPQVRELEVPGTIEATLGNKEYWLDRQLEEDEDEDDYEDDEDGDEGEGDEDKDR